MTSCCLGVDIGSVNVKACALGPAGLERHAIVAHEGDVERALRETLAELGIGEDEPVPCLATGGAGRRRLGLPDVIAARAAEAAVRALGRRARAVVSLGGEDLVVYPLDDEGRVETSQAGNKCASGTGEFFRQQLGRMGLELQDLETVARGRRVFKLSARCSVFMKSDCTHRLNKGEADKGDIALSLSKLMADKVGELLTRARIRKGEVVLAGGMTRNGFLLDFLRRDWAEIAFHVPEQARFLEAFGAAQLAKNEGRPLPPRARPPARAVVDFGRLDPLASARDEVRCHPERRCLLRPGGEYILGVDGGSTTTKVALVDAETGEIAAAHYGRTHGDPVGALKRCLAEVGSALAGRRPRILASATTGSSRELLGVFLETPAVFNEILAHAFAAARFQPGVDTLFEIGGQDAKYVRLNNGVPIDYAMNEACSAGTGSFLEESAAGDLDIRRAEEIGPLALAAEQPLEFGEHCSAFINSDIRKAIQQGAAKADIVAGLVYSIVSNYLNRVVGNRTVGERIVLQGGVARNPAVPLAFARLVGKPIDVPPEPELMGCLGVALLAGEKLRQGRLARGELRLDAILDRQLENRGEFACRACDNGCSIRRLEVAGHKHPFGGRCSKYALSRRRRESFDPRACDHVAWRSERLFSRHAPDPSSLVPGDGRVVGVPLALSVHSLWPFYARFFHELGLRTRLSDRVLPQGLARQESQYCYPLEIAHGAIEDLLEKGVDFVFLPHFRDMPSLERDGAEACACPLTQGLPYLARQAFGLDAPRLLRPVVSFKHGWDGARAELVTLAARLGHGRADAERAFAAAVVAQEAFLGECRDHGRQLLAEIEAHPERLYVALLGRPYNAFAREANMGIPRKLTSQGVSVVPFDLVYDEDAAIFPNMYWHYGQQDMKAVRRVQQTANLFLVWISNFSCAPDSFMLHYVRWMMGRKPYLVLEIDSHTADAGIDTRIEAFLDVVEGFRREGVAQAPRPSRRYQVLRRAGSIEIADGSSGERIDLRDPRVTLVWPALGDVVAPALAAVTRRQGVRGVHLPVPSARSTQLARAVASGKECIPSLLVLGSVLEFQAAHHPGRGDEVRVVYVPSTTGPCRTGQYHVFYDRLFDELGFENLVLLAGTDDSSYGELGPAFTRDLWRAIVLADCFTDARTGIRLLAADVEAGLATFAAAWASVVAALERGGRAVEVALRGAAAALTAIPRRRRLDELQKVLVVGEIYVRRDTFSVRELTDHLVAQGIFPKLSSVAEWIHYTDWSRQRSLRHERHLQGAAGAALGWLRRRLALGVESWWKKAVEHRVRQALQATGLVPDAPEDLEAALAFGARTFVSPELASEATVSPAVAAAAMRDGYSGVVIIAPFGCLPGRVIEGVYAPWARRQGYPVVALENDGQPYPPNVVARLEVFSENVKRYVRAG